MTELKAGTRGTWKPRKTPAIIISDGPDRFGQIAIKDVDGEYCVIDEVDFTPDPEPPATAPGLRWTREQIASTLDYVTTHRDFANLTAFQVVEELTALFDAYEPDGSPHGGWGDGPETPATVMVEMTVGDAAWIVHPVLDVSWAGEMERQRLVERVAAAAAEALKKAGLTETQATL